jgi:electron transfer flavoprotein beta subunit
LVHGVCLSAAIRKIGDYNLVLCGRQAADWNAGQIGSGIAEFLELPIVTVARKIEITDGKAKVERVTTNGYEVVNVILPALITVSNEAGELRYTSVKALQAASGKPVKVYKADDLGFDPKNLKARYIFELLA